MKGIINENFHLVEYAQDAIKELGLEILSEPIRGGTDGASLSQMGIPCPNLGTGAHNVHTNYEYVTLEDMIKSSEIIIQIVKSYARDNELIKRSRKPNVRMVVK